MTPPIPYIERTRAYYLALGYDNPYEWASFDKPAFTPLPKPLNEMTIALVVTAAPYNPNAGDQRTTAPYNAEAKFFEVWSLPTTPTPDLRISHISIDRDHTTSTDQGTYFPLKALQHHEHNKEQKGVIGKIASRVFGFPTNRSQRTNLEQDAPALLEMIKAEAVDAVILVPNCPVCHQSIAIAARHLEQHGIPTVVMGCAKDIVERARVARFLFSDFPLGNSAGKPNDQASQIETMALTLRLLAEAESPETTWTNPQEWSSDHRWKEDYANASKLTPEQISARRQSFDANKRKAKSNG